MSKTSIGIIRLVAWLVVAYTVGLPSSFDLKVMLADMFHGDHTAELRNTASVSITMFVILALCSFYIFQTVLYIFIGGALQDRNTSPINFIRHVIRALRENASDGYFWTSSSSSENTLSRVEQLLSYRDNKMALMPNADAAELMAKTSHVDMLLANPDLKQSKKALGYINNKIALMDNKSALEYIQGGKT